MSVSFSELLREAHGRFAAAPLSYGHGTENAWDEAVALLVGVTGLSDDESSLDAAVTDEQAATIRNLAKRRVEERRPLAYLLGNTPYCGERFHVPEGIVVPRSPIGPLLMDALQPWVEAPERILDLCCGSGCLGILAAKRYPEAQVVLADVDPRAVAAAQCNIDARSSIPASPSGPRSRAERGIHAAVSSLLSGSDPRANAGRRLDALAAKAGERYWLERRVKTLQSDLFAGLRNDRQPKAVNPTDAGAESLIPADCQGGTARNPRSGAGFPGLRFDLILCNPPYVDANGMDALPAEFAWEPALGLDGGHDGLALMNRVIGEVSGFLTEKGVLVGEVGAGAARLEARWPGVPFFWPDLPAGGQGVFLLRAADAPPSRG